MGLDSRLIDLLDRAKARPGGIVFLTGAGISAESGVPTFRGEEGYWAVGSKNYHPTELATFAAFAQMPKEVWSWYLYRRAVCRAAAPNAGHQALVALEKAQGDRFLLLTQNVDGLHLRAGNSAERTYQIHGNIDFMRAVSGAARHYPIPEGIDVAWDKHRRLSDAELGLLVCPETKDRARPHVLWFDEYYDEANFRFDSSLRAASEASLLVIVGTSGNTNLPIQVAMLAARAGAAVVAVNPEPTVFTELAERIEDGYFAEGTASALVPAIAEQLAR